MLAHSSLGTSACPDRSSPSQPALHAARPSFVRHRILPAAPPCRSAQGRCVRLRAQQTDDEVGSAGSETPPRPDADSVTKKWGLEAGLWNIFTSKQEAGEGGKGKGQQAKDLLKQYGSAYLITSISFAIVSFAACYALVSAGVDVPALFSRLGIEVGNNGERVGTFAIAYAAHKALSPVRFPPTVALTPVVARVLGKNNKQEDGEA